MRDAKFFEFLYLETANILEQCGFSYLVRRIYKGSNLILFQTLTSFTYPLGSLHNRIITLKNKNGKHSAKIIFQGVKYLDIMKEITKTDEINVLVWSGIKGLITQYEFDKVFIPPLTPIRYQTLNNLRNLDNKKLSSLINRLTTDIEKIKQALLQCSPDAIVLRTDSFPTDRAVILAARELGVPTINIQDGIYQSRLPLIHGRAADYVFVWSEYFKRLYLKQKIRPSSTIKILGYPYELNSLPQESKKQKLTVCYLGQNFELYNRELLGSKIETIDTLNKVCKKLGFEFVYRPHPGDPRELLQKKLPDVKFTPKKETLETSFGRGDIFVSFNSTALVEAALRGKLCIQLKSFPIPTDDFEQLGICPKSFDTIEELESCLKEIAKVSDLKQFYRPVNPEYIEIPKPDPGTKFLELIQDII